MPTITKKSRLHFGGLRRGYCENRDCPTRNVHYSVKRDPNPDAPAVCPRCQHPLNASSIGVRNGSAGSLH